MIKQTKNEIGTLISAIISLYLKLVKYNVISKRDINILYEIFQSTFQEKTSIQQIRKTIQNPIVLKQSANIINRQLSYPDKIKLLINLLLIAHIHKDFSVLARLDILEVAEILQIDVKLYSQIIDVIEGNSRFLDIDLEKFTENINKSIFQNFLIFGGCKDCDVQLRDKIGISNNKQNGYKLIILIVKNIFWIGCFEDKQYSINGQQLKPNRLYKFDENEMLDLSQTLGDELKLSYESIRNLYENKIKLPTQVIKYALEGFDLDISQAGNRLEIEVNNGDVVVSGNKLNPHNKYPVSVDDIIVINDLIQFSALDILTEKLSFRREHTFKKNYIYPVDDFFHISWQKKVNSIAEIRRRDRNYIIVPLIKNVPVFINHQRIFEEQKFLINKDIISIKHINFMLNKFLDLSKIELEISKLSIENLNYIFADDKSIALDNINFEVNKNEMLAIMGPSGSGKTSLLECLLAEKFPEEKSKVKIDDYDLYENFLYFQKHIGYVPQDDLLFPDLTVYENLYYCGKLRLPHIKKNEILKGKIDNILKQIGIFGKKDLKVGDVVDKKLSGGERKRLNIALELLSDPIIILLDEPTSGLSSKDSEQIIEMLTNLKDQGKIILSTIHQPNPNIFQQFDKILFMDQNGTEVFFGNTRDIFDYFDEELEEVSYKKDILVNKKFLKMAEYFFDILQYPLLDKTGSPIFEANREKRKYPPNYWNEKYQKYRLLQIITKQDSKQGKKEEQEKGEIKKISQKKHSLKENFFQIYYLFRRDLKNKLKNKLNLRFTFIAAPVLAILISFILRYTESNSHYSFYSNVNIPIFIFISVIVFVFLGLSNALDEIISEKRIILREKKLNIKPTHFLIVKNINLLIFSFIQCVLYFSIASFVLQIRSLFFVYIGYFLLSAFIGYSFGLLASAIIKDKKAIINVIPIILIPQIIFGGAVIEFEKMNRSLKINPEKVIPELCQFIPSRWLFEGLFTAQAELNAYTNGFAKLNRLQEKISRLQKENRIRGQEYLTKRKYISMKKTRLLTDCNAVDYKNENIDKCVNLMTGKFLNSRKNFFLSSKKIFFGRVVNTFDLNVLIIVFYGLMINLLTLIYLKYFFK